MPSPQNSPDIIDIPGAVARWWRDVRIAAGFLTILPVAPKATSLAPGGRSSEPVPMASLSRASAGFPVVGAALGFLASVVLVVTWEMGLPELPCALAALATMTILTGGLHEDGLADCADGFGGHSRDERLAIMRDGRIGAFGALALIFAVALRASLLAAMPTLSGAAASLVAAAALSRAGLPAIMHMLPHARDTGLSAAAGQPDRPHAVLALAIGLAVSLLAVGFLSSLMATVMIALSLLVVAALARRLLGGQTGDVLGAAQVVAEIVALAAIVATE